MSSAYTDSSPSPKSTEDIVKGWLVLSIRSSLRKQSLPRIIILSSFPSFPTISPAQGIHLTHADTHTGSLTATADKTKAGNHLTKTPSTENVSLYRETRVHFQPTPMKISHFSSCGIDFRHTTQLSIPSPPELASALQATRFPVSHNPKITFLLRRHPSPLRTDIRTWPGQAQSREVSIHLPRTTL